MFGNNCERNFKEKYGTSSEKNVTNSWGLWKISKYVGILSSIIALVGCFFPFVHNDFLGKNCVGAYVEDYGAVAVACFCASVVFSFLGLYRNSTVVLFGSAVVTGVTFWRYTSLGQDVTPALGFVFVVLGLFLLLLSVILGYLSHRSVKQSIVGNGFAIALAVLAGLGTYFAFHQSIDASGEITFHNEMEVAAYEELEQLEEIACQYLQYSLDGNVDGMADISMYEKALNEISIKVTHEYTEYYDNVELYAYKGYRDNEYLLLICYDTKFYGVDTITRSFQYLYLRENSQKEIKLLSMDKDLSEEEWKYIGEIVEINQELTDSLNKQFSDKLKTDSKLKETWKEIQEKLLEV